MKEDGSLRQHLVSLLTKGEAHVEFEAATKDMTAELQGKTATGSAHSPWQLLEHMRITQWDILEFIRDPRHVSPKFPDGYWPATAAPAEAKAWEESRAAFLADRKAIVELVSAESTALFAKIPHGDGQTILREVLLVADHTAYELGQFVLVRRLLGAWK